MPLVRVTIGRMVLGWDIGGVNTKVARVAGGCVRAVREQAFELQRAPDALAGLMRQLAIEVGMADEATHAVTMTAELSQMFRTKRDGVAFVLDAVLQAFPNAQIDVFTVDGTFVSPEDARRTPLTVAAANWMATALVVAQDHPDALLIDVGSTTTDLVPILDGRIVAAGRTDLERLASSELVYTGVLRTPVEAITSSVIVRGGGVGVAAEGFALIGDVHLWRGDLRIEDYTVTAPDGRPASREYAGERLARLVCADREMLTEADISAIADSVAVRQIEQLAAAIRLLMARVPALRTAMVAGRGAFLGAAAARAAGLPVSWLSSVLGDDASRSAPAAAVALLLEASRLDARRATANVRGSSHTDRAPGAAPSVDTVIKIGGGMLREPGDLDAVLAVVDAAAGCKVLLVPGGGPFADAVRDIDRRLGLSDDAAHWMAILAMDQYAELLAARLGRGVLVRDLAEARAAVADARVPVLAPSRWLREADPLPHSWDVTSDSLAAWVAGAAGASQLVLVKPRGAQGNLVDPQFASAVPPQLCTAVVTVDRLERIRALIHEPSAAM